MKKLDRDNILRSITVKRDDKGTYLTIPATAGEQFAQVLGEHDRSQPLILGGEGSDNVTLYFNDEQRAEAART